MSWLTFWTWRSAHHSKATRRAVRDQTDYLTGRDRATWGVEHPGAPLPRALMTERECAQADRGRHAAPGFGERVSLNLAARVDAQAARRPATGRHGR
jgi:hypothetical protein